MAGSRQQGRGRRLHRLLVQDAQQQGQALSGRETIQHGPDFFNNSVTSLDIADTKKPYSSLQKYFFELNSEQYHSC